MLEDVGPLVLLPLTVEVESLIESEPLEFKFVLRVEVEPLSVLDSLKLELDDLEPLVGPAELTVEVSVLLTVVELWA